MRPKELCITRAVTRPGPCLRARSEVVRRVSYDRDDGHEVSCHLFIDLAVACLAFHIHAIRSIVASLFGLKLTEVHNLRPPSSYTQVLS